VSENSLGVILSEAKNRGETRRCARSDRLHAPDVRVTAAQMIFSTDCYRVIIPKTVVVKDSVDVPANCDC